MKSLPREIKPERSIQEVFPCSLCDSCAPSVSLRYIFLWFSSYLDFVFREAQHPSARLTQEETTPARCRCYEEPGGGSSQRGRVVSPASFQSFSQCQMPGVLSRMR